MKDKYSKTFNVRVTTEMHDAMLKDADERAMPVATFMRCLYRAWQSYKTDRTRNSNTQFPLL